MRTAFFIALAALLLGCGSSALADDSNMVSAPLTMADKGPADYPPEALKNKEEGIAIILIKLGALGSKVYLVHSSGFDDLDQASLKIARDEKPTLPREPGSDEFLFGVRWSLNPQPAVKGTTIPLGN
jgi:TonB family protein